MRKVKVLLYCKKGNYKNQLHKLYRENNVKDWKLEPMPLNGKIVAECDCEKVEEISCCCVPYRNNNNLGYEYFIDNGVYKVEWKENINLVDKGKKYNNPDIYKNDGVVFERKDKYIDTMLKNSDLKEMCLTPQELLDYLTLGNKGYALHLSNLKTFDKPLELKDTYTRECNWNKCSKCEYGKDGNIKCCTIDIPLSKAHQNMMWVWHNGERKVLISIRPEYLVKILNGEKTIECRKRILKEMMSK